MIDGPPRRATSSDDTPLDLYADLLSHWTPRELAAEVILRGVVKTISARHVGRFLK